MLTNQTTRRDRVMGWLTLPKVITMLLKVLMMSERIFVSQLCYRSQQYVVRVSKLSNLARCNLKHKGDKRQFFTCQRQCPNSYPWVNNLNGNWAPRLAVSNNGILDLVAKMFNFRWIESRQGLSINASIFLQKTSEKLNIQKGQKLT